MASDGLAPRQRLKRLIERHGVSGFLRLPLYPLICLVVNPIMLARSLWSCRVLLNGRWQRYPNFDPIMGMVATFYWSMAENVRRYGFNGRSPLLGLGDYPLSRWFQLSLVSLYAFCGAGAVTLLLSLGGWLGLHVLWLSHAPPGWLLAVLALTAVSTTFYAQLFGGQNYNAVGWLFFPIGIYGLLTGEPWIAAVGWLLCSFGSFTAVFVACLLTLGSALFDASMAMAASLLPATLKLGVHFLPMLRDGSLPRALCNVSSGIGLNRVGVRYRRRSGRVGHYINLAYRLVIHGQFAAVCAWLGSDVYLLMLMLGVILLHGTLLHFGDVENVNLAALSVALPYALTTQEPLVLASYWLLAAPLPLMSTFSPPYPLDVVPAAAPWDIEPLLERHRRFLAPVADSTTILMAFSDPGGEYRRLFDGQRGILDPVRHIALERGIRVLPDWWAVFETNYPSSPDFWGTEPAQVADQARRWAAETVIIWQERGSGPLDPKWEIHGFRPLGVLRWEGLGDELEERAPLPEWWLLAPPTNGEIRNGT